MKYVPFVGNVIVGLLLGLAIAKFKMHGDPEVGAITAAVFVGIVVGGVAISGMPDHISIRIIEPCVSMTAAGQFLDDTVGNLRRLHPRALIERQIFPENLDIGLILIIEVTTAIAIPKVRHVTVLLGFAHRELRHAVAGEVLA